MTATLLSRRLSGTGGSTLSARQPLGLLKLAWVLFLLVTSLQASFAQTTTNGNLQWLPLKANNQDSAAVRAPGVLPSTMTLRNFYLSDVTLGTAIKPYSSQFGAAFGSSPSGDGSFVPLPGSNLNRVYYAQFTITAAANATLRADSLVFWSAFNNTASNLKLAVVYSKTGFTTNDSTEVAGGRGPIGPLTTRTATPGTGTGTFADPIFLRNQNTGPNQTYRLALNTTGGVTLAAGQTLTVRLYYASGSSSAGRYALLRDFRVVGQASTTSNCNAAFTYPANSFCTNGTNPTPTIAGTSGGTFSSTSGLSLNASTGTINLAASTPGTYTVTYSTGSNCSSTATVTVTAAPTATFSYANPAYCAGDGATPTPTLAAGATSGTFSSTSGLVINANTGAINLVASTPGTYTVTNTVAASGTCAAVTATTTVTISPATTATFAYSASAFCQSAANPTPTITGTAGGTFSSTSGLSLNASTGAINLAASTPGTYTVTYRVGGNCPSTSTQTVTISSAPLATFSYGNAAYCATGTSNPAPVFASGASAGTFSSTAGLSLNASTGVINLAASTPGTYTVTNTIAASGSCAASSATTQVTIQATPTATLTAGGPTTFCQGGSVVLTAPSGAGNTYQFLLNGAAISGATSATYTATASGSYSVVVTSSAGCTATSAAVAVTVTPATSATFAYSASAFCQSAANPTPTITGTSGGTFSSTSGLSLNASTGTINLTASTPGTYTVTYSVGGTCPSSSTQQVTITNSLSAAFAYAAGPYCAGSTGTVAPTLAAGASAGTFSSTAGLSLNASTGAVNLAASTPGTYTVTNTVAASGSCAGTSATATITILATPTATLTAGGPTTFCQGGSVVLTAPSGAGNTYQFLLNGAAISGATSATYTATASGSYSVVVTNAGGCSTTSAATSVTVNPATTATFSYPATTFCQSGANPAPTITGTTGGSFSSTAGLSINASTGVINLAASTAGTYTVTYSVGGTCPSSATATVTITTSQSAAFSYANASYCAGATGTVTPTLAAGATAGTFSSTAGLVINASTGAINLATSTPGTYTVTNTVAASGSCAAVTATTTVTINARPATPTLTVQYNGTTTTLTSSAATGNQFFLNGVAIAGATGQTYVINSAAQYGSYTVVTTNAAGCASAPSPALVVNSSVKPLAGSSLSVYPNPTHDGKLSVELNGYRKAVELTILNALGQTVFTTTVLPAANTTTQAVDLSQLPVGVYVLRAKTEGGLDTRRIVKE
ncbi:T9SS type A sorting domain-containing protein [Hymenobacter metallicola]|uniref:T9SS type A sorting domain-containing protein n=1 Tax=Hymenobacter metallicola TaxID=2563114 RepID=A0A4Z0PUX6_9BACT|nr:T9SS type A sorting domain-containing protein [Hymenobacter metallicola]TGE21076.1 T9SS type A sorting domain-containing protein [Hymenobacter metallicola]